MIGGKHSVKIPKSSLKAEVFFYFCKNQFIEHEQYFCHW